MELSYEAKPRSSFTGDGEFIDGVVSGQLDGVVVLDLERLGEIDRGVTSLVIRPGAIVAEDAGTKHEQRAGVLAEVCGGEAEGCGEGLVEGLDVFDFEVLDGEAGEVLLQGVVEEFCLFLCAAGGVQAATALGDVPEAGFGVVTGERAIGAEIKGGGAMDGVELRGEDGS